MPRLPTRDCAMETLAHQRPGFLSVAARSPPEGETVLISQRAPRKAPKAWACQAQDEAVQRAGRNGYYERYTMFSCLDPEVTHLRQGDDA